MGCEGAIIHRDLENLEGMGPKTLRVFRDFSLLMGLLVSCGAQAKGWAQVRPLSGWCGSRDLLYLG